MTEEIGNLFFVLLRSKQSNYWNYLTGVVLVAEEAIEGAEEAGDGLGFTVPVKTILQILSFVLFFFRVDICVEILAGM